MRRGRRARWRPRWRVRRPADAVRVVDLPQPEGPSRAMNSPCRNGQRDVTQRVEIAEVPPEPVEPEFAEGGGLDGHEGGYLDFLPPISSSQRRKAMTILSAARGISLGLSAMSWSYSGRPYSFRAAWLAAGAIERGDGP